MLYLLLLIALFPLSLSDSSVPFVGSTPCDALPRRFVGIPSNTECERISWQLALAQGAKPGFTLHVVYGMQANSAPGFAGGGTPTELRGTWRTVPRTSGRPEAVRLTTTDGRSITFVKVDDNLLHALDENGRWMVGNPGWSYTLSRKARVATRSISDGLEPYTAARRVPEVFEGRTPCEALENDLKRTRNPECTKVKWRLTLQRDDVTGTPTRYVLEGFGYRNPPRTGTWTGAHRRHDYKSIVIQLDPTATDRFLWFVRVDDNILLFLDRTGRPLVGDEYQSYTLNRLR